jgi:protein-S-isoprenylcysteine O-methyltransferase Ste14
MQAKFDFIMSPSDASAELPQVGGKGASLARLAAADLGLTLFVVPLIVQRIRREEEMLIADMGREYERYRQQVQWRLIPYVF